MLVEHNSNILCEEYTFNARWHYYKLLLLDDRNSEGPNSSKILCSMFVHVLFYVNLCTGLILYFWIICGLMTCVQSK